MQITSFPYGIPKYISSCMFFICIIFVYFLLCIFVYGYEYVEEMSIVRDIKWKEMSIFRDINNINYKEIMLFKSEFYLTNKHFTNVDLFIMKLKI